MGRWMVADEAVGEGRVFDDYIDACEYANEIGVGESAIYPYEDDED